MDHVHSITFYTTGFIKMQLNSIDKQTNFLMRRGGKLITATT